MEEWKEIIGYENYFWVSNKGRVKSKYKILTNQTCKGYNYVHLCINYVAKKELVSRLVAKAFIPNINDFPEINHKDENKNNNCIENLEWCTHQYNSSYGTRGNRIGKKLAKPIIEISLSTGLINYWESSAEIGRTLDIDTRSIRKCLKGNYKSSHGSRWSYAR